MQPLRILISGEYWDTQIYKGRLYLFGKNGDIRVVNWDKLIGEWRVEEPLRLAMQCAFSQSDYLYGTQWSLFFSDSEVRKLIQSKFERLATFDLQVSSKTLEACTVGRQDNQFPFPHADSTIYAETMYVASRNGVIGAKCNKKNKFPISTRLQKTWDCPVNAIAASYNTLALAAGDEGLFEQTLNGFLWHEGQLGSKPRQLTERNCTDCNWTFHSIYGSSHTAGGILANFTKDDNIRTFDRVISEERIFHAQGYSWGIQEKLCQVNLGAIRIVRYEPWAEEKLSDLGTIELDSWKGKVISGRVAYFGTIVECENALVVVPSGEGKVITIKGEPVNWRVFPRARHYENQLHVIYEDRLEVLSFNHDYFVDQRSKISGLVYRGSISQKAAA